MNIMPLKLTAVIFSFSFLFFSLAAISAEGSEDSDSVYLFYLYYDNDQLFADRDYEFKYEVVPEEFTPETYGSQPPFKGEIINFKNEVSAEFLFDPKRGDPGFLNGKIKVKAPYIPDGQKAIFYDSRGRTLLTIFVSESSFCDDNGICDSERGENKQTCSNDCAKSAPPPVGGNGGQSGVLTAVIYVLIILGASLGGWFGWRRYKLKKESLGQLPNNLPLN